MSKGEIEWTIRKMPNLLRRYHWSIDDGGIPTNYDSGYSLTQRRAKRAIDRRIDYLHGPKYSRAPIIESGKVDLTN